MFKKRKALIIILVIFLLGLSGCANSSTLINSDNQSSENKVSSSSDLNGFPVVSMTGSIQEKLALENFPDSEISYNSDLSTCIASVETKKAAFTIIPESQYETCKADHPTLYALYPALANTKIYFGAVKNETGKKYINELNEYLKRLEKKDSINSLVNKWSDPECDDYFDFAQLNGTNGTINFAVDIYDRPNFFRVNDLYGGVEAEIIYGFALEYGYKVEVNIVEFSAVLVGLSTGRFDLTGALVYTAERAETIEYSKEYAAINQIAVCDVDILKDVPEYRDIEALDGKKIAVYTGSFEEETSYKNFTNCEYAHFSSFVDCLLAVSDGKADATLIPESQLAYAFENYSNLITQQKPVAKAENCFGISKTEFGYKLQEQLSEYVNKLSQTGKLDEIWAYWNNVDSKQEYEFFDFANLDNTNGTISLVIEPLSFPRIHLYKDGYSGYEAELLYNFALEYGYGVDCKVIDFSSILTGMYTAKYDLTAFLHYTDERAQNVLFTPAYDSESIYCVVKKNNQTNDTGISFIDKLTNSFEKNFIREDRYKLLLSGLMVTIKITLLTALFGTMFGVILCLLRRSNITLINETIKTFVRIIQGVPIVVLLLVLYYIVFSKSSISGVAVGVIGFSLDFGVYVSEILRTAIEAVDKGQWEAASALGFNKFKTYVYIIIPQAIRHALPVYKGQFISMVKMTSVIGYVAVQDLTKVSDIIRSRTYDAFMPIISTALIYFILAWILTSALSLIEIKTDPSKRKNMLDGINTNISLNSAINVEDIIHTNSKEEIIRIEHLRKEYSNAIPLKDVNVSINKGDIISIIGPSGTGKSTLIRMLNRLEEPTGGTVYAFNKVVNSKSKDIYSLRAKMGMVFQSFNLFNHLTVIENIMLAPVIINGITKQAAYEKGMQLLKRVGLNEKALNYPNELSGGQKQRVAIVRSLAMDPEVMLLDEPTSALDPAMINEVLHVIEDVAKTGMTMLIVTHELKFAQKVANRVFYMDEGGIYEEGSSIQIFTNPQKEKTKAFIRRLKVLSLDIDSLDFDFISLRSKLENFGYQQMLKGRTHNSMVLCSEEMLTFGISKLTADCFPASISVECSEENVLSISFRYQGPKRNVFVELDEISKNIVKSLTDSLDYAFNDNDENQITFIIK